jgi:hypothetical protein
MWKTQYDEVINDTTVPTFELKTEKIFSYGLTVVDGAKCTYTPTGESAIDLTNELSAKEFGMRNFNDVIKSQTFKLLSKEADNIVFLGDIVYPESKRLQNDDENIVTMHKPESWTNRLNCAWNMFVSQLVQSQMHTGAFLNNKVDIITGNHSFDVNFIAEEQFNDNFMQKERESGVYYAMKNGALTVIPATTKRNSYSYVRKLTVKVGERKINFVDFNSAAMVCMHPTGETYYNTCGHIKYYQQKWTFIKALEYYTALVHVIKTLEDHAWNVIRAHHPPANFDDGDADFYWAKLIDNKSLMDFFKLKKVRFFFGSHIHTQAVISVPYKDIPMRELSDKDSITEMGAYCNLDNLKADASGLLPKTQCVNTKFVIDTLKEDVLLIFINGNSGRFFDPISTGTKSTHGNIIWARRNKLNDGRDAFGFSNVMFKFNTVQFEFYEIFDTKQLGYESQKVAEFKITEYTTLNIKAAVSISKIAKKFKKKNKKKNYLFNIKKQIL